MIVHLSSIVSYGSSLHCLDSGIKDRILFLDQNWSTSMQDDEINKEPSDPSQPHTNNMKYSDLDNRKSLDSNYREPSEQENSLKSQLQPQPLSK